MASLTRTFVYQEELKLGNFTLTQVSQTAKNSALLFQNKVFPVLYESPAQTTGKHHSHKPQDLVSKTSGRAGLLFHRDFLYFVQDFHPVPRALPSKLFARDRVLDAAILKNESFSIPEEFHSKDYATP